jgi:hypothetical protein
VAWRAVSSLGNLRRHARDRFHPGGCVTVVAHARQGLDPSGDLTQTSPPPRTEPRHEVVQALPTVESEWDCDGDERISTRQLILAEITGTA